MSMKGTSYYDMARDAGYKGAEAEQMAAALEADHRKLIFLQTTETKVYPPDHQPLDLYGDCMCSFCRPGDGTL